MDGTASHETARKGSILWLIWFLFLFVVDFLVPFTWLSQVQKITGALLFWIIWTLVAIISMFVIFLGWRE
jgi:hypothetical protein